MSIQKFALEKQVYNSLANVSLWGLCYHHGAMAFSSDPSISFGGRVVHFLIAAAEFFPIIGQIASIFEASIMLCVYSYLQSSTRTHSDSYVTSEASGLSRVDQTTALAARALRQPNSQVLDARTQAAVDLVVLNTQAFIGLTEFHDNEIVALAAIHANYTMFQHASLRLRSKFNVALAAFRIDNQMFVHVGPELKRNADFMFEVAKDVSGFLDNEECNPLRGDREFMLRLITKDLPYLGKAAAFQYALPALKSDLAFMSQAVRRNGLVLEHADRTIKNNRNVALAAIAQNPRAIGLVGPDLQNNEDFICEVVQQNGLVLEFMRSQFQNNERIAQAAIAQNLRAIKHVGATLRANPDFMNSVVSRNIEDLQYAGPNLKKSPPFMLRWVLANFNAFPFVDPALKNDKEFMSSVIERYPQAIADAGENITAHYGCMKRILERNGLALRYLHDSLKPSYPLTRIAIGQNPLALEYAHPDMQNHIEIVKFAMEADVMAIKFASHPLKDNALLIRSAALRDVKVFEFASDALKNSADFMRDAVKRNGLALKFVGDALKNREGGRLFREIVAIAVTKNGLALQYADEASKNEPHVVRTAIAQNSIAIQYAGEAIRDNLEFMHPLIRENPRLLDYVTARVRDQVRLIEERERAEREAAEAAARAARVEREAMAAQVQRELDAARQNVQHAGVHRAQPQGQIIVNPKDLSDNPITYLDNVLEHGIRSVRFVGEDGRHQGAIDAGGPTKQFLAELITALMQPKFKANDRPGGPEIQTRGPLIQKDGDGFPSSVKPDLSVYTKFGRLLSLIYQKNSLARNVNEHIYIGERFSPETFTLLKMLAHSHRGAGTQEQKGDKELLSIANTRVNISAESQRLLNFVNNSAPPEHDEVEFVKLCLAQKDVDLDTSQLLPQELKAACFNAIPRDERLLSFLRRSDPDSGIVIGDDEKAMIKAMLVEADEDLNRQLTIKEMRGACFEGLGVDIIHKTLTAISIGIRGTPLEQRLTQLSGKTVSDELQGKIDLNGLLAKFTVIGGYNGPDVVDRIDWIKAKIRHEFGQEGSDWVKRFLLAITGQAALPRGNIPIQPLIYNAEYHTQVPVMCKSHTCFNQLDIPVVREIPPRDEPGKAPLTDEQRFIANLEMLMAQTDYGFS